MRRMSLGVCLGVVLGLVLSNVMRPTAVQGENEKKAETRVFEARTYIAPPGKLAGLNSRFRDHTTRLFEKHGMKNIVYGTPIEKDGKPVGDKLVYLLAHKSQEAAQASFAAFGKDPEWVAARDASEKDGKIVSKVESQFLVPTDYSPMK